MCVFYLGGFEHGAHEDVGLGLGLNWSRDRMPPPLCKVARSRGQISENQLLIEQTVLQTSRVGHLGDAVCGGHGRLDSYRGEALVGRHVGGLFFG